MCNLSKSGDVFLWELKKYVYFLSHIVPNLYRWLSSVERKRKYFEKCAVCSFPCKTLNRDWTSLVEKWSSDAWFVNESHFWFRFFKEFVDLIWKKRRKETIWMIYSRIWLMLFKLLTDLVTVVSKGLKGALLNNDKNY